MEQRMKRFLLATVAVTSLTVGVPILMRNRRKTALGSSPRQLARLRNHQAIGIATAPHHAVRFVPTGQRPLHQATIKRERIGLRLAPVMATKVPSPAKPILRGPPNKLGNAHVSSTAIGATALIAGRAMIVAIEPIGRAPVHRPSKVRIVGVSAPPPVSRAANVQRSRRVLMKHSSPMVAGVIAPTSVRTLSTDLSRCPRTSGPASALALRPASIG